MIDSFQKDPESFPHHGSVRYDNIFCDVEDHLNSKVHKNVVTFAAIRDGSGYLTDHGPDHIAMVMRRAASLVGSSPDPDSSIHITPYEAFILLMSIHCHDVGNIYGRDGHEARITDVISKIPDYSKLKASEWRQIIQIASVHGGTVDDDKDTIGRVIAEGSMDLLGKQIRPQLLAANLRLADELADDHTRADDFGLISGSIPEESEVYHRYAKCLESVIINGKEQAIDLRFNLYPDDMTTQFGKKREKTGEIERTFLMDEIHERTRKTFCELLYCMKFMRSSPCNFQKVTVRTSAFIDPVRSTTPFHNYTYVLRERGYPNQHKTSLKELCDNFEDLDGIQLKDAYERALNNAKPT
jgi:hypothetical protein